jgi:hypothetical protein
LKAIPAGRFPSFREAQRTVNLDGHIEVEPAYYSAPPEYLGRRVWVRWHGRLVRLFNERVDPIAAHAQSEPGRFSTLTPHIADAKISAVERGAAYWLERIRSLGVEATAWAEPVLHTRGIEGIRTLLGLWGLIKKYPCERISQAYAAAHSHGSGHCWSDPSRVSR